MPEIKRIVYLEDSDDEVFLSRILLKRGGVKTELIHYARFDALEEDLVNGTLRDLNDTLVVVDLNLKISKGTDAVRRLHELVDCSRAIIGICTGSEDPADRFEVEAGKSNFFVGKPLDVKRLEQICSIVPRFSLERNAEGVATMALSES